jgi:hypothetical protein
MPACDKRFALAAQQHYDFEMANTLALTNRDLDCAMSGTVTSTSGAHRVHRWNRPGRRRLGWLSGRRYLDAMAGLWQKKCYGRRADRGCRFSQMTRLPYALTQSHGPAAQGWRRASLAFAERTELRVLRQ